MRITTNLVSGNAGQRISERKAASPIEMTMELIDVYFSPKQTSNLETSSPSPRKPTLGYRLRLDVNLLAEYRSFIRVRGRPNYWNWMATSTGR